MKARLLPLAGLLLVMLPACGAAAPPTPTPVPSPAPVGQTPAAATCGPAGFASLADFDAQLEAAVSSGVLDAFWGRVAAARQMPLVFGTTAVFLYRGAGNRVEWQGDFTQWSSDPAYAGTRQGQTDLWMLRRDFERDARLDYKILVDGKTWLLDPLNPYTQLGGYGPNSVLRMPDYVYPAITLPQAGSAPGTLGVTTTITSRALGYAVNYRVYTPAGYGRLAQLPVLYATDGQEYAHPEMGALPIVLDNLIAAGRIRPLIAVFVDPRDPASGTNRRDSELPPTPAGCPFCTFLTSELVPAIDRAYRTAPAPATRALLGTSLGGLNAAYMGRYHADVFGLIGIQSPYLPYWRWVREAYATGPRQPIRVFMSQGTYDLDVPGTRALRDTLLAQGYPLRYGEVHEGHSWGNWRGQLEGLLLYFFGATGPTE